MAGRASVPSPLTRRIPGFPPLPPPAQELLEIEPDAKWPLLTLVRLQELQLQVAGGSAPAAAADAAGQAAGAAGEERAAGEVSGNLAQEVAEGYSRLIELDPLRQGYYRDALAGRAHVVARPAPAAV